MSEIKHTDEFKAIVRLLIQNVIDQEQNAIVQARNTDDLSRIKYEVGVADGIRRAVDLLKEQ